MSKYTKVNIVESKYPPVNKYDWWYDENTKELKKNQGGTWVKVTDKAEGIDPIPMPGKNTLWILYSYDPHEYFAEELMKEFKRHFNSQLDPENIDIHIAYIPNIYKTYCLFIIKNLGSLNDTVVEIPTVSSTYNVPSVQIEWVKFPENFEPDSMSALSVSSKNNSSPICIFNEKSDRFPSTWLQFTKNLEGGAGEGESGEGEGDTASPDPYKGQQTCGFIIMLSKEPPQIYTKAFICGIHNFEDTNITIYVPDSSVSKYTNAVNWCEYDIKPLSEITYYNALYYTIEE